MVWLQILIDGFAIGSLYGLGAVGFTLMFGVSGVLNLAHGGIMVIAALIGWYAAGDLGFGTYSGAIVGVLTGTLLWGIMIQVGMGYLFTDNPVTMRPLIPGIVTLSQVRTPLNEIMIAVVCWIVIGLLWVLVNQTRAGKALLAASINPRGLTLLGFELSNIYFLVWSIYGVLAGIAGVLLATFLGVGTANAGQLTASAFSIVVLGGLGSVSGSLVGAYIVGSRETIPAYLVAPTLRPIPALLLLVLILYIRPQGLLGRR